MAFPAHGSTAVAETLPLLLANNSHVRLIDDRRTRVVDVALWT